MNDEQPWQLYGACRQLSDPDVMFPVGKGGPTTRQEREAKAVCAGCPVLQQCGQYALDNKEEFGVWGGMSERQRRNLLRKPETRRQHGVGRRVELTDIDVETVLARLDAGGTYPQVTRATRIGRDVCERIWREHRSSTYPPYRSKARAEVTR